MEEWENKTNIGIKHLNKAK